MSTVTTMLRDVDPQAKNFYYTTTEFIQLGKDYGISFTDPQKLLYNIVYHFGSIYDYAIDIMYLADPSVQLNSQGYNELGKIAGGIFTQTFYNFKDFEYPDVTIVYPAD